MRLQGHVHPQVRWDRMGHSALVDLGVGGLIDRSLDHMAVAADIVGLDHSPFGRRR